MSCRAFLTAAVLGLCPGLLPAMCPVLIPSAAVRADDSPSRDTGLLPPRNSGSGPQKDARGAPRANRSTRPAGDGWGTTLGGLAVVVALVFLIAKVVRKSVPAAQKTLPPEVVQVLGRKALDYRHTIHLVRFGSRMLMLGTSQEGMRTLSEITDPVEIDYLAGLCKPSEPASVASTFSQLFQKFQNFDPQPNASELDAAPGGEADEQAETSPAFPVETRADVEPDSDPAILRLQRRLQQTARGNGVGNGSPTTEAAG